MSRHAAAMEPSPRPLFGAKPSGAAAAAARHLVTKSDSFDAHYLILLSVYLSCCEGPVSGNNMLCCLLLHFA